MKSVTYAQLLKSAYLFEKVSPNDDPADIVRTSRICRFIANAVGCEAIEVANDLLKLAVKKTK